MQEPVYFLCPKSARTYTYTANKEVLRMDADFYFSYSYKYKWLKREENSLLQTKIGEFTHLKLTDQHLYVRHKQQKKIIPLRFVQEIGIYFRRLALPMITGGIVGPLAAVGLFTRYMNQWMAMSLLMIGLLLFYYGFRGAWQLVVKLPGQNFSLFVDDKSQSIDRFLHLANQIVAIYGK